jgi:leucyl-tRNA synthetase
VLADGEAAFDRSLPFSEINALILLKPYIQASLKFQQCEIVEAQGEMTDGWSQERADSSEPGTPAIQFWNQQ